MKSNLNFNTGIVPTYPRFDMIFELHIFWLGIIVVVLSEARNCSIVYSKLPNKTDENFVILRNFSPSTLFSPNKQKNSPTFLFFPR